MPPLTGDILWDVVKHIPRAKTQGLDAWSLDDLKALPREAFDDLAEILAQVEAESKWPEKLSGAIVALLPKKDDHGPLAQRSISLLPMVYKLWAAARGAILKDWFAKQRHASAWGQDKSKGADTAAWMAAAQAELASAGGYDAFAAYIDCEKCYRRPHIPQRPGLPGLPAAHGQAGLPGCRPVHGPALRPISIIIFYQNKMSGSRFEKDIAP